MVKLSTYDVLSGILSDILSNILYDNKKNQIITCYENDEDSEE